VSVDNPDKIVRKAVVGGRFLPIPLVASATFEFKTKEDYIGTCACMFHINISLF
jgi:hypothetical protein